MQNIEWKAFWQSLATIIVGLIIYAIIIEPIVKRFKIQIVKSEPAPAESTTVITEE